ncbi:MAG: M20 metallopeptidase family protein [bacterium]
MEVIHKKAEALKEELVEIRHDIHQHPELGFEEYRTTKLIKKELKKENIKIEPLETETGVLAVIKGEKPGDKVIALRGDMDALPIEEKTNLEYKSKNKGVMHACGHDGNTTVLLVTAKLLNSIKDKFSATVKFIFQPAEETLVGSESMLKAGVLENPHVDNIVGIHGWPYIEVGKIGVWSGPYMASADKFTVKMKGSGGHGAYPHESVDPVLAASTAVVELQNIVSRRIDALEKTVLSVCTLNGGKAFNVIPEEVEFSGTVRCHSNEVRDGIESKIDTILKGVATSFNCDYELNYEYGVPPVINDPKVIEKVSEAAGQVLGEGHVEKLDKPAMSSEDFSNYLKEVPGAFIRLGIKDPESDKSLTLHNDHFDFNDDAIPFGVSVLSQYVLNQ